MATKTSQNKDDMIEVLNELEGLLTERILENNTVGRNMMCKQHTHATILYRKLVFEALRLAKKIN